MKNCKNAFLILLSLLFYACGTKDEKANESTAETVATEETVSTAKPAVCIWKEISVKETPEEKGKYKTSIYLGEKITALEDTSSSLSGSKTVRFRKVQLTDGTQGWVREDFIALNGTPAAFTKDAVIYKRPDMMTTSGKNFQKMDFVAIKNTVDGGWAEVIGKRAGDSWFSSGWVKSDALTSAQADVAFSVFYVKAMDITDETKRAEELEKIIQNPDLSESVFQSEFLGRDTEEEPVVEQEQEAEESAQ